MFRELDEGIRAVAANKEARVVIVTGSDGDFSSGADWSESTRDRGHWLPYIRWLGTICRALCELPVPTIAKVRGVAVGAGANIALGCDLIVAADDARFGEIFINLGLTPDFGGSYLLPRLVGLHKAKQLAFFGDIITAAEAERIGIVNEVVAAEEIDAFVEAWANRLAGSPPLTMSMTKQLLNASIGSSLTQALDAEATAQSLNFSTDDTREALRSRREDRLPVYQRR
jgi:2-(1,2-epoxy-1,2-dihydrophenyl)acetyl-CoA isomerase